MLEPIKYEKQFATPLLRYRVPDSARLNERLLRLGSEMRAETEGVSKSNKGGWHSSGNLFDRPDDCIADLRELARESVIHATRKIRAKADPEDFDLKLFAWMNVNPIGGFNAPHTHPGAHWSGVYYVSQPETDDENAGMIEFIDPRTDLPNWRMLRAPAFRLKKKIRPEGGEIVLFPSYLVHWVYPNASRDERVTIAFNATFRKKKAPSAQTDAAT